MIYFFLTHFYKLYNFINLGALLATFKYDERSKAMYDQQLVGILNFAVNDTYSTLEKGPVFRFTIIRPYINWISSYVKDLCVNGVEISTATTKYISTTEEPKTEEDESKSTIDLITTKGWKTTESTNPTDNPDAGSRTATRPYAYQFSSIDRIVFLFIGAIIVFIILLVILFIFVKNRYKRKIKSKKFKKSKKSLSDVRQLKGKKMIIF